MMIFILLAIPAVVAYHKCGIYNHTSLDHPTLVIDISDYADFYCQATPPEKIIATKINTF